MYLKSGLALLNQSGQCDSPIHMQTRKSETYFWDCKTICNLNHFKLGFITLDQKQFSIRNISEKLYSIDNPIITFVLLKSILNQKLPMDCHFNNLYKKDLFILSQFSFS